MGYYGKLEEKNKAIKLRKKGLSYSEILKIVPVTKDTLSRWCRDIVLTPAQSKRLAEKKILGSELGRIRGTQVLKQRRLDQIKYYLNKGRNDIGVLSERDKFLIGISLYIGEGGKSDRLIEFANSDPRLISFMMDWLRRFAKIPEAKFRGAIWIHTNQNPEKAKAYWSEVTGIPSIQFFKTYIVGLKNNTKKIRKNLHEYGVFSIRVADARIQRQILGWSSGILI